jgi:hypothetical protein
MVDLLFQRTVVRVVFTGMGFTGVDDKKFKTVFPVF